MTTKKVNSKVKLVARLVGNNNNTPCIFCGRVVDNELIYGKLYGIGDVQCHYFCVLLSCCLVQNGKDEEGLLGFLYSDIMAEVERSKKHRCSYCGREGATLGCSIVHCRTQFHLPCGRERNAISLFYDNYKSYCQNHAPKQNIPNDIMIKAKARRKEYLKNKSAKCNNLKNPDLPQKEISDDSSGKEIVCVICYEAVEGYPTTQTFWPPCCARDAWFHRSCLQRMALSAGMHYLKCPLCNDKENFYEAVVQQGYYVPDRDAAWELEQNAFAEIYERQLTCGATVCHCPQGREHDADMGMWDLKICLLCGSSAIHLHCMTAPSVSPVDGATETSLAPTKSVETILVKDNSGRYICNTCQPAAPEDLDQLESNIAAVTLTESHQEVCERRHGPVMPSRMSLRRTKQRVPLPSTSSTTIRNISPHTSVLKNNDTTSSREELNLKTPRRFMNVIDPSILRGIENKLISPIKMLEQELEEKLKKTVIKDNFTWDSEKLVEKMRKRFKKPKPLSVKRKIIRQILEDLVNESLKDCIKPKDSLNEWRSPKKYYNVKDDIVQMNTPEKSRHFNDCIGVNENQINIRDINTLFNKTSTPDICMENPVDSISIQPLSQSKVCTQLKFENDAMAEVDSVLIDSNDIKLEKLSMSCCDESSNSTFQLPSEFIADNNSDDSLPVFDTPKTLKTVDIQKNSSMEISEKDQAVNIDVIKMIDNNTHNDFFNNLNIKSPVTNKKCAFKFSPIDKETLQKNNVDIDIESFKSQYLNEIDKDFKCNYGHKHKQSENVVQGDDSLKLRSVIDFAVDAALKRGKMRSQDYLKQISSIKSAIPKKKRKISPKNDQYKLTFENKNKIKRSLHNRETHIEIDTVKLKNEVESIDLTKSSDIKEKQTRHTQNKKLETKVSIQDKNIKVKIKWKTDNINLKISKPKEKRNEHVTPKKFKQYILNYSPEAVSPMEAIKRPNHDIKRKYVKHEKNRQDKLKQMSIHNFFKITLPST